MFFHNDDIEKEYLQSQDHLSKYFFTSKNYFFGFFGQIFEAEYSDKLSFKQQLKYEIVANIVTTLQATSIIWYPNLEISEWSSYKEFWKMIGIINYDHACALFKMLEICYYGTIFLIGICCISFGIFLACFYLRKDPSNVLVLFISKIVKMLSTLFLIPSIMIFLIVLKYSIFSSNSVDELDDIGTNDVNFGIIGIIISAFCLLILVFLMVLYEIFSCDINHSNYNKNIKARACATLDLQRQLFFIFMCISYVCFGKNLAIYHQIICCIYTFLLGIKATRFYPYFNYIENAIQACKMWSITLTLLIFIFGNLLDNSLIIFVFSLILQPILLLFLINFTSKRYKTHGNDLNDPENQFDFERKYRTSLTNPNPDEKYQILKLFSKHQKLIYFNRDKLFVIWEFNFCISVINDERLARVKLTKLAFCKNSLEGDVQEWRVYNWLKTTKGFEFPEVLYLEYLQDIGILKERDEELCNIIIQLQTEFASRAPKMRSLVELSTKTSKILYRVNEGYNMAAEKYKNSETFDLYASYLERILKDHREANRIKKKASRVDYSYRKDNLLERYGNHIGILLISCQDSCFGNIIYMNEKASEILKLPMIEVYTSTIFTFLPHLYGNTHEKLMKKFINHSESVEVPFHNQLFFQNQYGFLTECNMLIRLTAFHNNSYFLISFQQRHTQRQFALISDEDVILGHSEFFSNCLGCSSKYVKNSYFADLCPFIDIDKLKENKSQKANINNKEMCFIYAKKTIRNERLNILCIIDNDSKIKKFEKDKQENRHENPKSWIAYEKIEDGSLESEHNKETKEKTSKSQISFKDVEDALLNTHDNSPKHHISSDDQVSKSSSAILKQSQDLILKSKKWITILKWVLFIVTLAVIVTMGSIMANIVNDVNLTSSMIIFRNLGDLLYNIGLTADSARTIDKAKMANFDYSAQIVIFANVMKEIQTIQNDILSDFEHWKFCSAYDVTTHPLIPMWSFDEKSPYVIYENMYNAIESFLFHIRNMNDALKNNKTYKMHSKFLILNGLGQTYDSLNHTILDLEDCAISQIESIGNLIYLLILWGIIILAILFGTILLFIYLTARKIDEFWNFFIKKFQISMMKLKSEAMERLIYAHNTEASPEESVNTGRIKTKRKVRTWIEITFTWKILIFVVISASYYFLMYFYLYPDCQSYMINRPKLLNIFNLRRSLVSRVSIFSRDVYTPYFKNNFISLYGFANSHTVTDVDVKILKEKNKELREEKFMKIMSKELKEKIFESSNLTHPLLKYGSETAIEISIDDNYYIAANPTLPPLGVFQYVAVLQILQNNIDMEFQLADGDSHDAIERQLNVIIATTAIYIIIFCGLYFIYYLPFLHYQIKQLNWLSYLIEILSTE
ncbi:unnamed protein product [Blepharisma stoltei]|uniref:TmcB/TmcC TPR repeats domain-containing protein n=1 Tax=Blepharisma stoltei TaxID=1481888 RepID=A0AAU9IVJ0_9CILI|nr:unnamed protein product [Blepharisma stoltei]